MHDPIRKQFPVERSGDDIVVTTNAVDRERDRVFPNGLKLDNYMRNPVLLWGHNYRDPGMVIGRAVNIRTSPDRIVITPELREPATPNDPMHIIKALWESGLLRAASIGFLPTADPKPNEFGGYDFPEAELLEISLVPVPANQEALRLAAKALDGAVEDATAQGDGTGTGVAAGSIVMELDESQIATWSDALFGDGYTYTDEVFAKAIADAVADNVVSRLLAVLGKGVIPYKKHPLASEDTPWDGPAERRRATVDDLRVMCAWYDSSNPDVKSSYKLPHHRASDHYTVWNGVRAAMAALLGARGGVDIPDADRRGVYNHLARHYRDFDREPPEFREYTAEELKELFPEYFTEEELPAVGEAEVARLVDLIDNLISSLQGGNHV